MKRLVIDDVRSPNFEATISRHVGEALELIRTQSWDEVWLDHDMDLATTGSPDVSWMTNRLEEEGYDGRIHPVKLFILHSANIVGRRRMRWALEKFYDVIDLEQYHDKTVVLKGGPTVEMHADGKHQLPKRADSNKWWAENSHDGLVAITDESSV